MATFHYEFCELPLVIAPGIEGALINGRAEIEYQRDGYWRLGAIEVEGYRSLTMAEREAGVRPWVYLAANKSLTNIIAGRLKHEWSNKVDDAVAEQIETDRECAADDYADMKREQRLMERM